ncbi:N(4)-acetylcytidine aminohydrolase [Escherichia coli]|nr:N(4)-acetylcytidine aminohydrolase [Escherichia coli]
MQPNDITFFQRFQDDILAGRKTITIRNESESHFRVGDILRVGRYEDDVYFCTIEVIGTSATTLDGLTEEHAQQENMSLAELKAVIAAIYPGQNQFYVIDFKVL